MANPFLPDLSNRYHGLELIDNPDFTGPELGGVLHQLARVNKVLGNYRSVKRALIPILQDIQGTPHIVDLGCGGGDLLCYLSNCCRNAGIDARFTGIDFNPNMLSHANQRLCKDDKVNFLCRDILHPEFEMPKCDIALSSHFIYRMQDEELKDFLANHQSKVSTAFVFSELRRNAFGYFLFLTFGRLLFPERVTISDGLMAIRRSFTFKEFKTMLSSFNPRAKVLRQPFFRQIAVIATRS